MSATATDTVWLLREGRYFWVNRDGVEHERLLGDGAVEVERPERLPTPPAIAERPVATVWLRTVDGRDLWINRGDSTHERLVSEGAVEIEDPRLASAPDSAPAPGATEAPPRVRRANRKATKGAHRAR